MQSGRTQEAYGSIGFQHVKEIHIDRFRSPDKSPLEKLALFLAIVAEKQPLPKLCVSTRLV
jgi:hypothetical protein